MLDTLKDTGGGLNHHLDKWLPDKETTVCGETIGLCVRPDLFSGRSDSHIASADADILTPTQINKKIKSQAFTNNSTLGKGRIACF